MNGTWPLWVKIVSAVGFPIAVATWLIVDHSGQVNRLAAAQDRHVVEAAAHHQEAHIQTVLLRAICRNTAKTEFAAQFCEYGLPQWSGR